MIIKKKDKFVQKDKLDTAITKNSFTQAVEKAGSDGINKPEPDTGKVESEESRAITLGALDDLMRAKEAKNDTSVEGEKYRRDE